MARAIPMVHEQDPRALIWADVKPHLEGLAVLGARVLVGVYVPPEKTASGLYITSKSTDEAKYQGKIGLVLRLGPIAFEDDANHRFGSLKPRVNDWVVFNVGDTFGLELGDRRARNVEDVDVHMIIENPDSIR